MNICFDIDECLILNGEPIVANVELVKVLATKHKVYLWSGNGFEHAYEVAKDLQLTNLIQGVLNKYGTFVPDVAFDNQEVKLGKLDIKL